MKALFLLILSIAAYGQATINAPAITLDAPSTAALTRWMISQSNSTTTLASGIDAVTTTVVVSNFVGAGANAALGIDGEIFQCSARTGNTYTCTRAQQGTAAATHASGATVTELKYKTLNAADKELLLGKIRGIVRDDATVQAAIIAATAAAEAAVLTGVQ